jgi:hypothetical protein
VVNIGQLATGDCSRVRRSSNISQGQVRTFSDV